MEEFLSFDGVNWLSVVVAAAAAFALGALWYGQKMFAKSWMKELGLKKKDLDKTNMTQTMSASFALMLMKALFVALSVRALGIDTFVDGLLYGAVLGLFVSVATLGVHYLYQLKTSKIFLIDGGYSLAQFLIMGVILAVWQ